MEGVFSRGDETRTRAGFSPGWRYKGFAGFMR